MPYNDGDNGNRPGFPAGASGNGVVNTCVSLDGFYYVTCTCTCTCTFVCACVASGKYVFYQSVCSF